MAQVRRTAGWMAIGGACGLTWGIAIRAWMRLISDEPEFSLGGTLAIVGTATIVGLGFGLALSSRTWTSRTRPVARWLGGVPVVFLGAGAGSITLPTIVFGGLALGTPRPRLATRIVAVGALAVGIAAGGLAGSQGSIPWVVIPIALAVVVGVVHPATTRATLAVLAIAPIVMVTLIVLDADLPLWRRGLGMLAYPAVMTPITLAFSRIAAPLPARVVASDHATDPMSDASWAMHPVPTLR